MSGVHTDGPVAEPNPDISSSDLEGLRLAEETDLAGAADRYAIYCAACGDLVTFEKKDIDTAGNQIGAAWMAGYHDGKHHGDSDFQHTTVVDIEEITDD